MSSLLPVLLFILVLLLPRPRTPRRPAGRPAHEIVARVAVGLGLGVLGSARFGGLERGRFLRFGGSGDDHGGGLGGRWGFGTGSGGGWLLGLLRGGGFVFVRVGVVVPADVLVWGFCGAWSWLVGRLVRGCFRWGSSVGERV